jgi:hypothetical protein
VGCVCQVAVMQVQSCPFFVRIRIESDRDDPYSKWRSGE